MLSYRRSALSRPLYAAAAAHGTTQGWPRCGSLLMASPASSPARHVLGHRRRRRRGPDRARRLLLEGHASRRRAPAEPIVRPARVATINFRSHMHSLMLAGIGGAAHRDDAGLPRRRQGDLARGRCRRHRAAGPAHCTHRSDRLPARRRQCARRPRLGRSRLRPRQGRSRSLPDAARQCRLHDPDARHAAVGLLDDAGPGRPGQEPALVGREQPRLHRAACRRRGRHHRRPGRGRPGAGAGPGHGEARPQRRARDPGRRARAPAEDRARREPGHASSCGPTPAIATRPSCASCRPAPIR